MGVGTDNKILANAYHIQMFRTKNKEKKTQKFKCKQKIMESFHTEKYQ